MDAIAMFKQAAAELQKDPRCLELAAAREANDNDEGLQEMIGEFNLVRLDLNNEMEKADRDDNKVAVLNTRINELYNGIMTRDTMLAYNEAKQDMQGIIAHINAIVTAAVDGEDPMAVEEPVSGCGEEGCASCAGCG